MTATLKDLAKVLVAKHQLKQRDAEVFVNAVVDTILEGLQADRIVKIKGFGTFKLTAVRDRESVNVNTGERIVVSGHDKISFTPDSVMRDMVNKPFAHFDTVVLADGVNFEDMPEGENEAEIETETEEIIVEEPVVAEEPVALEEPVAEEPPAAVEELVSAVEVPIAEEPVVEEPVAEEKPVSVVAPIPVEEKTVEVKVVEEKVIEEKVVEEEKTIEQTVSEAEQKEKERDERIKINGFYVPTDEDEDGKDDDKDFKKVFIVYAIIANILIAAIAFVLGYMCCSNGWIKFQQVIELVPEEEPVDVLPDSAAIAKKAEVAKIDSIKKAAEGPAARAVESEKKEKEEAALAEKKAAEQKAAEEKAAAEKKLAEQKAAEEKAAAEKKLAEQKAAEKKLAEQKAAAEAKQKSADAKKKSTTASGIPDQTPYIKDVRVKTGAYYIVGTQATVKVQAGQTIRSISKRYLGDGMECYLETYNGGVKTLKEGQTLKIPKLQLKKSIKK